ncbi:YbaB/EbfC family nucleoid-associated protein [Actinokineospora sp.]|uniref:YbaB/EbfC family nucleoid-associated protein n=1 Tax=Actinokineospora sp. TaxID=1872133 RepID=UPI003D6BAEA4
MDEAKLQATMRRFEEQAARASALKESIAQLKGSARNGDGSVTVTVAPSGAVLGLQLGPAAMKMSHVQLTQEILGTIRQATQQAAAAMEQLVRPAVGEAQFAQFQEAFRAHTPDQPAMGPSAPPPPAALPAPPPPGTSRADFSAPQPTRNPRPPSHVEDGDDDDFSTGSIFGGNR